MSQRSEVSLCSIEPDVCKCNEYCKMKTSRTQRNLGRGSMVKCNGRLILLPHNDGIHLLVYLFQIDPSPSQSTWYRVGGDQRGVSPIALTEQCDESYFALESSVQLMSLGPQEGRTLRFLTELRHSSVSAASAVISSHILRTNYVIPVFQFSSHMELVEGLSYQLLFSRFRGFRTLQTVTEAIERIATFAKKLGGGSGKEIQTTPILVSIAGSNHGFKHSNILYLSFNRYLILERVIWDNPKHNVVRGYQHAAGRNKAMVDFRSEVPNYTLLEEYEDPPIVPIRPRHRAARVRARRCGANLRDEDEVGLDQQQEEANYGNQSPYYSVMHMVTPSDHEADNSSQY
ncbi:hypothetical protein FXO38_07604 [Capsicum annuum]|nr:hypothetical protein FXO38_07604 [Capsicum annuum]